MKVTTQYHLGGKYDVVVSGGGPSGGANGFFPRVLKNTENCDIIKPERRQVYERLTNQEETKYVKKSVVRI